jgi:hypothetical protein
MEYDFGKQFRSGKDGESEVISWLKTRYEAEDMGNNLDVQRSGIDLLVHLADNSTISLEVKCDKTARRTQNLFFETVSVDKNNTKGWGTTSQAKYLIYLIPDQEIIVIQLSELRNLFNELRPTLKEKTIPNKGYNTLGFPISLNYVRNVADYVENFPLKRPCGWQI